MVSTKRIIIVLRIQGMQKNSRDFSDHSTNPSTAFGWWSLGQQKQKNMGVTTDENTRDATIPGMYFADVTEEKKTWPESDAKLLCRSSPV